MLAVLVGSLPFQGPAVLSKLGIPYILLADPGEIPPQILTEPRSMVNGWTQFLGPIMSPQVITKPVRVVTVPFKSDPLSILKVPFDEDITNVFSFTEMGQFPAALLAEALGVPTVGTAAVLKTRNKFYMRRALVGLVAQPEFGLVEHSLDQKIPYPVVVKPVDSSGSRGVQFVDNSLAFKERAAHGNPCIWEQYIGGREFSVEVVTFSGAHEVLGITEKITTGPPYFVEEGHLVPARLSAEDVKNITTTVTRCLDGLGIRRGASHTEVKYMHGQTFIVETHTRAGGDRITLLTELVSGYTQRELAVRSILGLEPIPPREKKFKYAGICYFKWSPGIVSSFDGVDDCLNLPGVVELELKLAPGNRIRQWHDSTDRPGYVVVGGDNPEEVQQRLTVATDLIKVRYVSE